MAASTSTTNSSGGAQPQMDRRLLEAATSGDSRSVQEMASQNPSIMLGTTPQGNTCLHISPVRGHEGFCMDVLALNQSLLSNVNSDEESPLIVTVTGGCSSLASFLLRHCCILGLRQAILQQDKHGCNALHHAIRCGHKDLALELIAAEPALSQAENKCKESPMFIAVMRDFTDVFEKLLEIPDSTHGGHYNYNALHAAVRNGNPVIAKKIMETRPWLAREESKNYDTPIALAVLWDKTDVLQVLLEHDLSLGYEVSTAGNPLLVAAAHRNHAEAARVVLDHCPDAPYRRADGLPCLHYAVSKGHMEFVEFILGVSQLRKLVNMRDKEGKTALHYAVTKCNPKIVAVLLSHKVIDTTMTDDAGYAAAWILREAMDRAKTLNWNEVSMLMLKVDPQYATFIYNLHEQAKEDVTNESRKDAKSLTQTYTTA